MSVLAPVALVLASLIIAVAIGHVVRDILKEQK
jgi:hypothetical protein